MHEKNRSFKRLWLVAISVIIGTAALSDVVGPLTWGGGWTTSVPSGHEPALFVLPVAVVLGILCGVLLVTADPGSFLSEDGQTWHWWRQMKDNVGRGLWGEAGLGVLLAIVAVSSVVAVALIPILLVEWGIHELVSLISG